MTIDKAYEACKKVSDSNFSICNFLTGATVKKFMAWRPGLFPKGFAIEDGQYTGFGISVICHHH